MNLFMGALFNVFSDILHVALLFQSNILTVRCEARTLVPSHRHRS